MITIAKTNNKQDMANAASSALSAISIGRRPGLGSMLLGLDGKFSAVKQKVSQDKRDRFKRLYSGVEGACLVEKDLTSALRAIEVAVYPAYAPSSVHDSRGTLANISEALQNPQGTNSVFNPYSAKDVPLNFAKSVAGTFGKIAYFGKGNYAIAVDPVLVKSASELAAAFEAFSKAPKNGSEADIALYVFEGKKAVLVRSMITSLKTLQEKVETPLNIAAERLGEFSEKLFTKFAAKEQPAESAAFRKIPIRGLFVP